MIIYFCDLMMKKRKLVDYCPYPRKNSFENFQKEFQKSMFSSQLIMIIVLLKLMMTRRKLMATLRMKAPFVHC